MDEEKAEQKVKEALENYKFVFNKDNFVEQFQIGLGYRLLTCPEINIKLEEMMIHKSGHMLTSKLAMMRQDSKTWQEVTVSWATAKRARST